MLLIGSGDHLRILVMIYNINTANFYKKEKKVVKYGGFTRGT